MLRHARSRQHTWSNGGLCSWQETAQWINPLPSRCWLARGREWTLRREGPPFAQRFRGTFSEDDTTLSGRWEIKEPGQEWSVDFDVTYTRVP